MKLAGELQKRSAGRSIYVLDEPTTGLHFEDIRKLLGVLQGLVDKGNSVIVIEHNLDVIKSADWVVDLGPEGGSGGGTLVAEGTPEEVAAVPESHTGRFLADLLDIANPKRVNGRNAAIRAGSKVSAAATPRAATKAAAVKKAPAKKAAVKKAAVKKATPPAQKRAPRRIDLDAPTTTKKATTARR